MPEDPALPVGRKRRFALLRGDALCHKNSRVTGGFGETERRARGRARLGRCRQYAAT